MKYLFKNCNEAFLRLSKDLINNPDFISNPRGLETREKINVNVTILNPRDRLVTNKYRGMSLKYLILPVVRLII